MAKLTRLTGKVFAGTADLEDLGVFGSAKAGNPTNPTGTNTEAQIQSGTAYDEGWTSAVVTSRNFPPVEEVNGVLRTISYQNCYILQEGIPEYDVGTEYSNTSIVKDINGSQLTLYVSLINNNIGNPLTDTDSWAQVTINNAPSNSNLYDGQWTVKPYTIGGSYYKIGTYSFTSNMNSYLPPDGYNYEVLFGLLGGSGSNSAGLASATTSLIAPDIPIFRIKHGDGNNGGYGSNCFVLPIAANRIFEVTVSNANFNGLEISFYAYRRLGTNV